MKGKAVTYILIAALALLAPEAVAYAQTDSGVTMHEELKALHVTARGRRRMRLSYGLPLLKDADVSSNAVGQQVAPDATPDVWGGEVMRTATGVWLANSPWLGLPLWVAWDTKPGATAGKAGEPSGGAAATDSLAANRTFFAPFLSRIPKGKNNTSAELWHAIAAECRSWADEKPSSPLSIVCGTLTSRKDIASGTNAKPYAFYVVMCRKTDISAGYKSVGFIILNAPRRAADSASQAPAFTKKQIYAMSTSVNFIEFKSGFDFFSLLPKHLQEAVEDMTTYELFSTFQESGEYRDPREDLDFEDFREELFEDLRSVGRE